MLIKTSRNMLNLRISAEDLLAELEIIYPPVNHGPDAKLTHIMYRSGQRSVVEWIKQKLQEDN